YNLRYFQNIARTTVIFDALNPPPGSARVDVDVVRVEPGGQRLPIDGVVVEGAQLVVGIKAQHARLEQAQIGGDAVAFVQDPVPDTAPLSFDFVPRDAFVASPAGTYRVDVTAVGDDGVRSVTSRSFRVVPQGGDNSDPDPKAAPAVLDAKTFPRPH